MNRTVIVAFALILITTSIAEAQRRQRNQGGNQPANNEMVDNPLAIGDSGVAWYTTWDSGVAEAERSNRPIFFMSAATTCSGVPGVF